MFLFHLIKRVGREQHLPLHFFFSCRYDIWILRLKDEKVTTIVKDARRATSFNFQYKTNDKKIKRLVKSSGGDQPRIA